MLEQAQNVDASGRLGLLTPRELEVLELIANGHTNAQAARTLEISVHAVKFHLAGIYRRLGVTNRTAAAVAYLQSITASGGPAVREPQV